MSKAKDFFFTPLFHKKMADRNFYISPPESKFSTHPGDTNYKRRILVSKSQH